MRRFHNEICGLLFKRSGHDFFHGCCQHLEISPMLLAWYSWLCRSEQKWPLPCLWLYRVPTKVRDERQMGKSKIYKYVRHVCISTFMYSNNHRQIWKLLILRRLSNLLKRIYSKLLFYAVLWLSELQLKYIIYTNIHKEMTIISLQSISMLYLFTFLWKLITCFK